MGKINLNWSDDFRYIATNANSIPTSGGVYKVLRNDGVSGKLTRVYVGKATELRSRYNDHLSPKEQNTCLRSNIANKECYFRYALLASESDRVAAETYLLANGKYECNNQGQ